MLSDVLVVGSGPGGANAAAALTEAGLRVTLLDFGNIDDRYAHRIPDRPFADLRRTDPDQYRYLLGESFEGVPFGNVRVGAQLTPPRQHVHRDVNRLLPLVSTTFAGLESLARGGLGAAWGAGAFTFNADECARLLLTAGDLRPHYDAVVRRIGVSGSRDDLSPFLADCEAMQPPLQIDQNAQTVLERYQRRRETIQKAGFHLGRTRLAVCTQEHAGREANQYHDLDFWSDAGRSVYRPQWTLESLARKPGFAYVPRRLVRTFQEAVPGQVEVETRHADTGEKEVWRARALVLAAGALGTARIVIRSLGSVRSCGFASAV